jgi:hypothetical protein
MKLKLKRFDISRITPDKIVVLIGKRNTGKSYIVRDIMYNNKDLPIGTVISPTEMANKFYGEMIPKVFIHEEYTPKLLENVIIRQKMIMKQVNKEKKTKGYSNIDPRCFLVMDDCLYDNDWVKDKNIRSIFLNGRHYKIFFIMTSQYVMGITPILRSNIDFTFILRENIMSNRMLPTYEAFCSVLDNTTENYECLVIDNTTKSNKLEDQIFWFKAEERPNFKLGASQFWLGNDADSSDSDSDEEFNMSKFKKKSNINLNVKKTHY